MAGFSFVCAVAWSLMAAPAGYQSLATLSEDLDGDGEKSKIEVSAHIHEGLLVEVHHDDELVFRQGWPEGSKLRELRAQKLLNGAGTQIILKMAALAPDEEIRGYWILGKRKNSPIRRIFSETTVAAVGDPSLITLGPTQPDLHVEGGPPSRVFLDRGPSILTVDGPEGPVRLVVGMRQSQFVYEPARGQYVPLEDRVKDYMKAKPIESVRVSKVVASLGGTFEPERLADGDLTTAWKIPKPDEGEAAGAARLDFPEIQSVRVIRMVPGCASDTRAWQSHYVVRAFQLQFGIGSTSEPIGMGVDLGPTPSGDFDKILGLRRFPLANKSGEQVVIVLKEPVRASWARVSIDKVERQNSGAFPIPEACISEITFY